MRHKHFRIHNSEFFCFDQVRPLATCDKIKIIDQELGHPIGVFMGEETISETKTDQTTLKISQNFESFPFICRFLFYNSFLFTDRNVPLLVVNIGEEEPIEKALKWGKIPYFNLSAVEFFGHSFSSSTFCDPFIL